MHWARYMQIRNLFLNQEFRYDVYNAFTKIMKFESICIKKSSSRQYIEQDSYSKQDMQQDVPHMLKGVRATANSQGYRKYRKKHNVYRYEN